MSALSNFFRKLCDSRDWPTKWSCGNWSEFEGWLYISSSLVLAASCIIIPIFILRFVACRRNISFAPLYYTFSFLILALGIIHIIDVVTFWSPLYRVQSLMLVVAGLLSLTIVFLLFRHSTAIRALRPVSELKAEIARRKVAEEKVNVLNAQLEQRVQDKIREVAQLEHKFTTIVEKSAAVISLMAADMSVGYANPAAYRLTGRTEAESKTTNWTTLVHPDDAGKLSQAIERAISQPGTMIHVHMRIMNSQRGYLWAEGNICNMLNDPAVEAVVFNFTDTTEMRNAEAEVRALNEGLERKVADRTMQLEATNRELEAFSYSVSHDMRAPLRIISGYADILNSDYTEVLDTEGKRLLNIVIANTKHMSGMIDALLNLARMGRKELLVTPADMASIVTSTVNQQLAATGSSVKFNIEDILPAQCDSVLMRHVWSNLIANAIKYTSSVEHPTVTIGSEQKDGKVVYYIKDNGVGFDMQYAHKLFGVFQRLHKKSEFDGTGIGLAIVQRIILKHGGYVWADGEEHKGATFFFTLPAK